MEGRNEECYGRDEGRRVEWREAPRNVRGATRGAKVNRGPRRGDPASQKGSHERTLRQTDRDLVRRQFVYGKAAQPQNHGLRALVEAKAASPGGGHYDSEIASQELHQESVVLEVWFLKLDYRA